MNGLLVVLFCAAAVCSVASFDPTQPKAQECMTKYEVDKDEVTKMQEEGKPSKAIACAAGCAAKGMTGDEMDSDKLSADQNAALKECIEEIEETEDECKFGEQVLGCAAKAMQA